MSIFLFKKEVDQSLLKSGLTIPINMHERIQDAVGVHISKGQRTDIKILLNGKLYDAVLTNVNLSEGYSSRVILQIRYSEGSPICQKIKTILSNEIKLDSEDKKKYIEVYATDNNALEFRINNKNKEEFIKYIGPINSLNGYQRSYKLVFLKAFFSRLLRNKDTLCEEVTTDFRQFYIDRINNNLIPDINADPIIENIEKSNISQIYNLILRNPYNAINSAGYILIENETKERFVLNDELKNELNHSDYQTIIELVDEKLRLYYSKIDEVKGTGNMREFVEKMLNEYVPAKAESFTGHPLGVYFRNTIPQNIYDSGIVDKEKYLVTGSVGQGNWAMVPWVCIFDRNITTTAQKGVYICYLLEKSGQSLYLTFNQGCTEIRKTHKKEETIAIMRENAKEIISKIDSRGFRTDEEINLGRGLTELGVFYQKGTIFYKEYRKDSIPEDIELRDDLMKMMDIYREYSNYDDVEIEKDNLPEEKPEENRGEDELTVEETINRVKKYIEAKGFSYEKGLIENFYLSLKSKPFVILAGISGTGKTRLVRLFAEAVGANTNNGRYKMVSVRPDWSDSSDLFGHVDLNGKFVPGAIIEFVKRAALDTSHPYFLCLDEMNLARVEYYLSDFLSVIETRDFREDNIVSEPLVPDSYYGSDASAAEKFGTVSFPENLYVIGTVNMDETTFPFSRKVLDRANTIEFSYVDLTPPAEWIKDEQIPQSLDNKFLRTEYLLLAQCTDQQELINEYSFELQRINRILQQANAHVGYRVRDEIIFYLINNNTASLLSEEEAMDNEIIQKILPRIQGSSAVIKNMLCELFKVCAGDYEGQNTETEISSKMMKVAQRPDCRYPKSAQKIAFMVRRFEEDGFTSYWL